MPAPITKLSDRFADYILRIRCPKCGHERTTDPHALAKLLGSETTPNHRGDPAALLPLHLARGYHPGGVHALTGDSMRKLFAVMVAMTLVPMAHPTELTRVKFPHSIMARCWAFYSWQSRTSNNVAQDNQFSRAAVRVRARMKKELGTELADGMMDAAMFTWQDLSPAISDAEWERLYKVMSASCLDYL